MTHVSDAEVSTLTPSGGRQKFGQMKADIAAYYGMDGDTEKETLIGRMIYDAVDDLNMRKLWQFNLIEAAPFNTVAGQTDYALPDDLWKIYSSRKSDGVDYMFSGMTPRMVDILFQSQSAITGYPYIQYQFNIFRDGTLKLFPIPDAAYPVVLRYFQLIGKPVGDDEFLDMPSPYQVVPKWSAMAQAAALVGVSAQTQMIYWTKKFEEAYKVMNRSDEYVDNAYLRFINIEEAMRWSYINPSVRPRYFDIY